MWCYEITNVNHVKHCRAHRTGSVNVSGHYVFCCLLPLKQIGSSRNVLSALEVVVTHLLLGGTLSLAETDMKW